MQGADVSERTSYGGLHGCHGFSPSWVPGYDHPDVAGYRADAPRER